MNIEILENSILLTWGTADQLYYHLPYPLSGYTFRGYDSALQPVKNNKDMLENEKLVKVLRDNKVSGKVTYRQFDGTNFEYWGHQFDGRGGYVPLIGKETVKFEADPDFTDDQDLKARRLVYKRGNSNKFWQVETKGLRMTRTYGKVGTDGQVTVNDYDSREGTRTAAEKLINEKLNEGYRFA